MSDLISRQDAIEAVGLNTWAGSRISKLPTVDAIPVEWIEEWLENIKNDERYKSEYVELDRDVKQVVIRGTILINIPCISDMLEDWKKENAID